MTNAAAMPQATMLAPPDLLRAIELAPLVSVDLLILGSGTGILLGLRNNRPAAGTWFVPGGRIAKDETIAAALIRVAGRELGLGEALAGGALTARPAGVFEHFYPDNFAGREGLSTHYVVLAHRIELPAGMTLAAADDQHADLRWWPLAEAAADPAVHENTKVYCRMLLGEPGR